MTMKQTHRLLASLATISFPLFAQDVDLHLTCKKGDTQLFKHTTVTTQSIDFGGQQMDVGNTTVHVLAVEITDVDKDGNVAANIKVVRTHGSIQVPMMPDDMTFDSAAPSKDDDDPMGISAAMTGFAGKSFPVTLTRSGHIVELKGATAALKEVKSKLNPQAGRMLGASLNESSLVRIAQSLFGYMPEKPASKGATWDREVLVDNGGAKLVTNAHYALGDSDDKKAEFALTGTIAMRQEKADKGKKEKDEDDDAEGEQMREMMKSMKINKSKVTGKEVVARDTGLIHSSQQKSEMSMTMEMQGTEINVDITLQINVDRATDADTKPAAKAEKKEDKKEEKKEPKKEGGK